MASGRQVEYDLRLRSNAVNVLDQSSAAASKFDNSMWQVQKTLASFGLGLGAHFLIDAAKNWTQAAADYETAMLRIKNASKDGIGLFNEDFLNKQVDNFKLKLQETADAYGNFLFKTKNAGLGNDISNRLFENLNVVGKVGGIPQEQMDATVRNVGILLGEGVLEARHLRQLAYVHPQIVPFLADALGLKSGQKDEFSGLFKQDISDETAQQKLSQLISSGKLTKLGLNSSIIIEAFEKYRESIESKLPETLDTVQSHLNNLSNTWERFKNSMVLDQKPELVEFFKSIEGSVRWLGNHEEQIIHTGKAIFDIVKLYAEWRIALMALQIPSAIVGFFANEHARLNSILTVGNSVISEKIVDSEILIQSTKQETESIIEQNEAVSESIIEMDLFTEAQLSNIAATEKLIEIENQLTYTQASLFRGFGYGEGNATSSGVNKYRTVAIEEEQTLWTSFASNISNTTGQMGIFTQSEMDAQIAIMSVNEQLEIQNGLYALNQQMLKANAAAIEGVAFANINSSATIPKIGNISGVLSSTIMSVFIAGMAVEVADQLFPHGKVSGKSLELKDWLYGAGDLLLSPTPFDGLWHDRGKGFGKVKDIAEENAKLNQLHNLLFNSSTDVTKNLPQSGTFLYNLLSQSSLLNEVDPLDKYGKRKTSNTDVYDLLHKLFSDLPYVIIPTEDKSNTSISKSKTLNIPSTTHLLGNSVYNTNINIHELNGMKNPKFENVNSATMQDVKNEVGVEVTRMMLEIINDSQIVRGSHGSY